MDSLYFVDVTGEHTRDHPLLGKKAWADEDDNSGIVRIQKSRQKKLSGAKNMSCLSSKSYSKQLSRFQQKFSLGDTNVATFKSFIHHSCPTNGSSLRPTFLDKATLPNINYIDICDKTSVVALSSYRNTSLFAASEGRISKVGSVAIKAPFNKSIFSPDGSLLLSYGNSNGVSLYDLSSLSLYSSPKLSRDESKWCDSFWSKDSRLINLLSDEGRLVFIDERMLKLISSSPLKGVSCITQQANNPSVCHVGLSNGDILVYDIRNNSAVEKYSSSYGRVSKLCVTTDGSIYSGHSSGFLVHRSPGDSLDDLKVFDNYSTGISDLSFDESTNCLLSCSKDSFKATKILHSRQMLWSHLSNHCIVPSHVQYSRFIHSSSSFVLASEGAIFLYSLNKHD